MSSTEANVRLRVASVFDVRGVPAGCLPGLFERAKVRRLVVSRYNTYEAQPLGPN